MSQKHHQRTRAEILAKRAKPIEEVRVQRKVVHPITGVTTYVPQPTHSERLRTEFDASKYMPHIGAKEQERAKRCYMDAYHGNVGEPRSAPVLCQKSKVMHEAYLEAREQECESVF